MMTAAPTPALDGEIIAYTVRLPRPVPPMLGLGAFLKNTVCVTRGGEALVSRDVGNLDTVAAVHRFVATVERLSAMAGGAPVLAAHDLHPDFYSTRHAGTLGIETVAVQHHHAHTAAVMAEHGRTQPVLGMALDGFGLGPDNQPWGGELLLVGAHGYQRLGHLRLLKQPGGDAAARQPWRMGAAALHALGRGEEIAERYAGFAGAGVIAQMLDRGLNCPDTSSAGRLFDAACGLLGVKLAAQFEGEAPMHLEQMVTAPKADPGLWRLADGELDLLPLLDRLTALDAAAGADLFHGTLIAALADWAAAAAAQTGLRAVALSGGCMLNKVLRTGLEDALRRQGLTPLLPVHLAPGDTAISLGQVWAVALMRP